MSECNCSKETELKMLREDIERNTETHKQFYARFEELSKSQAVTEERYTTLISSIAKLTVTVESIKERPSRYWDKIVVAALSGIVGYVISLMF